MNRIMDDDVSVALKVLVRTGRVSAHCSKCTKQLTADEHEFGACPVCGGFCAQAEPVYRSVFN